MASPRTFVSAKCSRAPSGYLFYFFDYTLHLNNDDRFDSESTFVRTSSIKMVGGGGQGMG